MNGRYRVVIELDNDAFYPDPAPEIVRILENLIVRLRVGDTGALATIYDSNGNAVGWAGFSGRRL